MHTLSDLVARIRQISAGRPRLLSIKRRGRIEAVSTSELLSAIQSLAIALERRGLSKGDRVAILSENCPEWHVVDLACQLLGIVVVPIYPTLTPEQVAFILKNSGSEWIFYSDRHKAELIETIRSSLNREITAVPMLHQENGEAPSLVMLQAEGAAEASSQPLEKLLERVEPDDIASIIYTSGTTGEPKGVVLSHRNFASNVLACSNLFELSSDDQALSFLPLSHVFERTVDYLFLFHGVAIHYAPSIERLPPLLLEVKPTVLTSVPRVYERAYLRVQANIARETAFRQRLFRWAVAVGRGCWERRSSGRIVPPWLALERAVAERLVYRKIKGRFGGRLRFAIAGGAPLSVEVGEFFDAVGLPVLEGYGLTETAPVLAVNTLDAQRRGSVGQAPPGVELRIDDDGEILAKTPGLMVGYWGNEEATREAIDADGWFHTGDVGHLDEDGFLFITDRKKDLLVTSGGKNVAPQPIEQKLTAHWAVAQAVVFGDRYPYLTALLVPNFDELPAPMKRRPTHELIEDQEVRALIQEAVDSVNRDLGDHERIRKWQLLPRELTLEEGEITPTLKVRRRVVRDRYADLIASMYLKTQKVGA